MELDRSLARLLLRLALGLNLLVHGVVRVSVLGAFAGGMARDFSASLLFLGSVVAGCAPMTRFPARGSQAAVSPSAPRWCYEGRHWKGVESCAHQDAIS